MSALDSLLWGILPYVVIAVLVVGLVWRYRYDQFGWTTRSSQLYENRLLRTASPLFHFGLLVVVLGHFIGLVIPESWTATVGVGEFEYHVVAVAMGTVAGVCTLVGIGLLIYRRRTRGPVFMATTRNDKLMYVVLTAAIVLGLLATMLANGIGNEYNYRATISVWFRSIWVLQPEVSHMDGVPLAFKVHILVGMLLFAIWPFTRLVHAFSAPVGYLFRPYIVYRTRDGRTVPGSRPARRGWERSELPRR